ncbi:MAG: hypothetical protein ACK58T_30780, partial [Phycisphaerae bacterium]
MPTGVPICSHNTADTLTDVAGDLIDGPQIAGRRNSLDECPVAPRNCDLPITEPYFLEVRTVSFLQIS